MQNRPTSWTRWIIMGGAAASVLLIILLLISLYTAYATPNRQLARQYQEVALTPGVGLEIIYPQQLLMDAAATFMLNLAVSDASAFTKSLTVMLDLPSGIMIRGTAKNQVVFHPRNSHYQQITLTLQNSGVIGPSQSQVITLTNSFNDSLVNLPIRVESVAAAAWRTFILGVLSDNGPLLLALAALLPISGLILQQTQKQEEQKTKEYEQNQDQQKKNTLEQITVLSHFLSQGNRVGVKQVWEQLQSPLFSTTKVIPSQDRLMLKQLVTLCLMGSFVDAAGDETWLHTVKDEWLDELVGALVGAGDLIDANAENYRAWLRDIPINRVTDLTMRNRFIRLWQKTDRIPLQNWPQEFVIKADVMKESRLEQTGLHGLLTTDPFLHERAEDEETTLFERNGFWFGHPVYNAVANATQLQIVYGPPGCGRTTLAKGLCHNESHGSRYFWVYQPVYPGLNNIAILRSELAEHFLQYILEKPTLLLPIQENTRRLMAEVLVEALDKQSILARLEQAHDGPWLDKANAQQRPVWQKVGETQLTLLSQSVEAVPESGGLAKRQWAKSFCNSLQPLGYHGVRLVLDFSLRVDGTINIFLPTLHEWQYAGLVTTLFIPVETLNLPGLINMPLLWSQTELKALIKHRFHRLANVDSPANIFSPTSVYDRFIQAVVTPHEKEHQALPTPYSLIQLWQTILENMGKDDVVDAVVLAQAVKMWQERARPTKSSEQLFAEVNLSRLIALMDEHFDGEEVHNLCVSLGIDYDNLKGIAKIGKIREVVLQMNREGRLPELVAHCREARPHLAW